MRNQKNIKAIQKGVSKIIKKTPLNSGRKVASQRPNDRRGPKAKAKRSTIGNFTWKRRNNATKGLLMLRLAPPRPNWLRKRQYSKSNSRLSGVKKRGCVISRAG